jgi:hypothetical protein
MAARKSVSGVELTSALGAEINSVVWTVISIFASLETGVMLFPRCHARIARNGCLPRAGLAGRGRSAALGSLFLPYGLLREVFADRDIALRWRLAKTCVHF